MPTMPLSGYFNILSQTYTEKPTEPTAIHIDVVPKQKVRPDQLPELIKNLANHTALWAVHLVITDSEKSHYPTLSPEEKKECVKLYISLPRDKWAAHFENCQASTFGLDILYKKVELTRRVFDCARKTFG